MTRRRDDVDQGGAEWFRPGLRGPGTGTGWQGRPLPGDRAGLGEWARAWLLVAFVSAVLLGCLVLWGLS